MKILIASALLAVLSLAVCGSSALAQDPHDPHPTITAVHRYGHRKVAHTYQAVTHVHAHVKHWVHRKAHNTRAWLNSH